MKKLLKIILLVITSTVFLGVLSFFYLVDWGSDARKSKVNVINSEKLEIGMDSLHVKRIMGEPDSRSRELDESGITFYYQPPIFASDGIYLHFDSLGHVQRITYFE
ncbi:hypothetical protein ACV07N_04035 [Roseivirga echinicomitans]